MSTTNSTQLLCSYCSQPFIPELIRQKLCSDNCRKMALRLAYRKHRKSEKGIASTKRYRQTPAAKRKKVARTKKYRELHEHVRISNRQTAKLYYQLPRVKEAHRLAAIRLRERRRNGIPPRPIAAPVRLEESFTLQEWTNKLEEYGNACACCGTTEDITVDHIVPLSKGGPNTIKNVQPLCRSCNARKQSDTVEYQK